MVQCKLQYRKGMLVSENTCKILKFKRWMTVRQAGGQRIWFQITLNLGHARLWSFGDNLVTDWKYRMLSFKRTGKVVE